MISVGRVESLTDFNKSIYCEVLEVQASTPYGGFIGVISEYTPFAILGEILLYDSTGATLQSRTIDVTFKRYREIELPEATAGQLALIQYTI